ncbi:zinc finger protein 638-like [Thalassophryne amazonica]|uniref:zinc finger protein 638-like n=1 Tax=Thalassophryne amazonica TaxID=390379 RepID=UPI0014719624|nr:zinc finger protein 638-like [Thalassophryne amazonica]
MDEAKQDGSSENQQMKPLESQTVHNEPHQALHSMDDDGKRIPAGDTEIKTESSFQVLTNVAEDPTTEQEHGRLVKDDKPKINQLAQENTTGGIETVVKCTPLNTVPKHVERTECMDDASEASKGVKTQIHGKAEPFDGSEEGGLDGAGLDTFEVLDSIEDLTATNDDEQNFFEDSVQVLKAVLEDKVMTDPEETHQAKDDNATYRELPQEHTNPGTDAADKTCTIENPDSNNQETSESSEDVTQASKGAKSTDTEIPSEDHTFEDSGKGAPDSATIGPDTFEVLDSVCDPAAEHNEHLKPLLTQKQTTPSDNTLEDDASPVEVLEDEYQIIDSVEEEPTTTESELEKDKRSERESTRKEDRPERSGSSTRGTHKGEDIGKSPNIYDRRIKYETRAKKDRILGTFEKDKEIANSTEEMEFQIVDSVEDESVQDAATTGRSSRRSSRRKVEQKTVLVVTEASCKQEEGEEPLYEILDSVEDEATDEPPPSMRAARKKSERTTLKETSSKKEAIPTTKRCTTRVSQERHQEMTRKKEDEIAEESTSSKKSNVMGREQRNGKASTRTSDSGQDKPTKEDQTLTTRSTRARRETVMKREASNEKAKMSPKEDVGSKKRRVVRESQERISHRTPQKEDKVSSRKESTKTNPSDSGREKLREEEDVTYQILDSVEEEVVKDDPPTRKGKQKGRPKKAATRESTRLKERDGASEEMAEAMYQILDSVEDDDLSPSEEPDTLTLDKVSENVEKTKLNDSLTGSPKLKEEEEEPLYQIVDSVEDEELNVKGPVTEDTEGGRNQRREQNKEAPPAKNDPPICPTSTAEDMGKQETLYHVVDSLENAQLDQDLLRAEVCDEGKEVSTWKKAPKKEDKAAKTFPAGDTTTPEGGKMPKPHEKNQQRGRSKMAAGAASALVDLEEVSEQEEDFSDSAFDEEKPGKRQATARKKQLTNNDQRNKMKDRGQKRRSHDSGGDAVLKRVRGRDEEMDTKELVTLDEVGADESEEEMREEENTLKMKEWDGEITEGKLDENVKEEETKAEQSAPEPLPPNHEHESVSPVNSEVVLTLDETDDGKKEEAEKPSRVEKRRHSDVPEEMSNFVTVDELVAVEEAEQEVEEVTTKASGRPNKRSRQTIATVRKSTRGNKGCTKDEKKEESPGADAPPPTAPGASSSLDGDMPALSDAHPQAQKTAAKMEGRNEDKLANSSGGEEPKITDQKLREEEEEKEVARQSGTAAEVPSKPNKELVEPEAKRPRAESLCAPAGVSLPPFKPDNPLGQEFVVPKSGFFCSLCSIFFTRESVAKQRHCGTQKHYDSLQKYYQNHQRKTRSSKQLSEQASSSNLP